MAKRILIIGLDGVPYSLLTSLREQGVLPNLDSVIKKGLFGSMEVCLPPISSVSWSSFMTGKDPSYHGVYGFTDITAKYQLRFPFFADLKVPTFFDLMGEKGCQSVVINLPSTYPVRAFPGVLISGFVAVELARAVYPPSLLPRLQAMKYRVDLDLARARSDKEFLFKDLQATLELRRKAVDLLWKEIPWTLFMVVVTGTDRLHHYAFDSLEDPQDPHHQAFVDYYRSVDSFIGEQLDRFEKDFAGDDRLVLLLSDHGFTGLDKEVYINRLLVQKGFLAFSADNPKMISDLDPKQTRAFALDPGRIYVNLKGRFSNGTVEPSDREKVLEELSDLLTNLHFNERSVAAGVYRREDLYRGPLAEEAPDLVFLTHRGFDPKGAVASPKVFGASGLTGMHTHDDAFYLLYASDGEVNQTPQIITDLSGIVLDWLDA
ncbi:MAG: alkaline phosphatase family protein [Proteobacteria bacterium]|jgi:predicted AlkP superfamily phosphohydrolase/phosphomutase|nr:alkaline phosphatase family protein [Pseudomonadota bacterium]